jgi:hypothetical protein
MEVLRQEGETFKAGRSGLAGSLELCRESHHADSRHHPYLDRQLERGPACRAELFSGPNEERDGDSADGPGTSQVPLGGQGFPDVSLAALRLNSITALPKAPFRTWFGYTVLLPVCEMVRQRLMANQIKTLDIRLSSRQELRHQRRKPC